MKMVRFEDWEDLPYNFSTDLYITCAFGEEEVKKMVSEVIEEQKEDYQVFTRLIFDLNLMCWYFYELQEKDTDEYLKEHHNKLGQLFSDLYYSTNDKFYELFENDKDAMNYHFEKLD